MEPAPAQSPAALPRPRLERMLDESLGRRLTEVTAGAGSGKTTLLAEWVGRKPVAWHTVGAEDVSLSALARNVLGRLRLQVPDLSPELVMAVSGVQGPDVGGDEARRADSLAAELCRDLDEKLVRDLVLVLDDVHLVGKSVEAVRFLAGICRHAPPRLHMVTASREPLPFPTTRMQLQGDAATIGADLLAFTPEEATEVLIRTIGEVEPEVVEELMAQTGGWTVAVALVARLIGRQGTGMVPAISKDRSLFDYLAEEVFAFEDGAAIEAMRQAAELPWLDPGLAETLGMGDEGRRLLDADRMTVFVTRIDLERVELTPLVRQFLLTRYPLGDETRSGLLSVAADWYQRRGALTEALECLLALASNEELARFLTDTGEAMLVEGMTRSVVEAIDSLPPERISPELTLLEAEARQILGDWEGAAGCFERLTPSSGPIPARLAWRLGLLHHMRGDVSSALEVYGRGTVNGDDPVNEAALMGWHASAYWLRGDRDNSERLAAEALALARRSNDHRTLATAHTVLAMVAALDGDRAGNDVHYLRALEHAEQARDVVQTIRIRSNRGSHFLEQGELEPALAELEIALRLADMTGFALWRAMALSNRAQVLYYKGRLEEAVADLDQAREIFRRLGSTLESYPLSHLGDVYALRGDKALARTAYEHAVSLSEGQGDVQALVPALSGLARVVLDDEPIEARRLAARASEAAPAIGHVRALLAAGFVARATGRAKEAMRISRQVAQIARSRIDLPGLAEALELEASVTGDPARAAAVLDQVEGIWAEMGSPIGQARVEMARAAMEGGDAGRVRATATAALLDRHGAKGLAEVARRLGSDVFKDDGKVRIKTLGGVSYLRGETPIPTTEWQSKVARDILAMLIATRGRPLHREVLIERLWPGEDVSKASNRLSVALTTIRNVLDPERTYESNHFLITDRETISLNLENVTVDLELFLDEATRGRALVKSGSPSEGLRLLRSAESRYMGLFLEEQLYADWSTSTREAARAEFMSIGEILAGAESDAGDHDAAARWYLRILEEDPYNETAHLALVSAMVASGRHGTARRLYGTYVSRMAELDVEPAGFPSS